MNRNDKNIISFTITGHALVHTYELSIPIFMTVWLLEFPVSTAALGIIVAIGYGLFGVGAVPGGIVTDMIGSRWIIIACLIGMGVSFLLVGIATNVLMLALALAIWGAAASVYHPAGLSLISKGVSNPGRAFGFHGAGGNVGIAFGPLVTALLLIVLDWRTVAILLGLLGIAGAMYGYRLSFEETAPSRKHTAIRTDGGRGFMRSLLDDVRLLATFGFILVISIVMFNGLFYRGLLTFLPEVLDGFLGPMADLLPDLDVGGDGVAEETLDFGRYLYIFLLMVGIIGQYTGGILVDRIASEKGLAFFLGAMTITAGLFVPLASIGTAALLFMLVILGFVMFAIQPMTQTTVAKYSPSEVRGLSYGFTYLAVFGIGALGAAIAGLALDLASVPVLFLTLAAIASAGCLLSLVLIRYGEADYLHA